jgi:hypothetical protein
MIIPVLIISVIFAVVGFTVTGKNAKYLLSGYNMMSEEQRSAVDIGGYLHFFKRFHFLLAGSLFILVMTVEWISPNLAGIMLGVYPLLGYCYFIMKSSSYFPDSKGQNISRVLGVGILMVTMAGVGYLFVIGYKDSSILLVGNKLEITGMYGEKIEKAKVINAKLVSELPEITMKSNGFAAGDFRKGYFRTKDRKKIKLFVNKKQNPLLLLNTTEGEIYFSSSGMTSEDLLLKIQKWKSSD